MGRPVERSCRTL
jgi:predicted nucleic acid-binding protein